MTMSNSNFETAMIDGHTAAWDQEWETASKLYRKAVELNPKNSLAITSLGLAFYELGKLDEALVCYKRASQISPEDPLSTERMAEIHIQKGNLSMAVDMSMAAADLHLKLRDADKAIQNWKRVVRIEPNNLKAISRLAVLNDRIGNKAEAVREYINLAANLQEIGQINQAIQAAQKAVDVDPQSGEALQALKLVQSNKTLAKPQAGFLPSGEVRQEAFQSQQTLADQFSIQIDRPDPISETRQKALTSLAEILFELNDDTANPNTSLDRADLSFLFNTQLSNEDMSTIAVHLGQAIDYQTRMAHKKASKELQKAVKMGLVYVPAFFCLGYLYYELGQKDKAQIYLSEALAHPDYALASHFLLGELYKSTDKTEQAAKEFLQALKIADLAVVQPELKEIMAEQYEELIEEGIQNKDKKSLNAMNRNIINLLNQSNWQSRISEARSQLPSTATGSLTLSLADLMSHAESSEMVQFMSDVFQFANAGHYRSAMEEAFNILSYAPNYLPLHEYMGELLMMQNKTEEAIQKYTSVVKAYTIRGEEEKATKLLKRLVEMVPLELSVRYQLIQRYIDLKNYDDAISEYIELAEVNKSLAKLEAAKNVLESALILANKSDVHTSKKVQILHSIADIDLQNLNWRDALDVYEEIIELSPNDELARLQLIEVNLHSGEPGQSQIELDNFLFFLSTQSDDLAAIHFVEKVIEVLPNMLYARKCLAEIYQQIGRSEEAIEQWDQVAEKAVRKGQIELAKEALRAILMLNPPDPNRYRILLQQLG